MTALTAASDAQAWPLYLGILIGLYASEDLSLIAAGLLIHSGRLEFLPTLGFCLVLVPAGDLSCWGIGRWLRTGSDRAHPRLSGWMRNRCEPWSCWFERRGMTAVIAARFIPGSRMPTYLAAGLSRMPVRRFALAVFVAATIWVPLVLGVSCHLGGTILEIAGDSLNSPLPWLVTIVLSTGLAMAAFRRGDDRSCGDADS